METMSTTRALAIFSGYMLTASALTTTCLFVINKGSKKPSSESFSESSSTRQNVTHPSNANKQLRLQKLTFAVLAVFSLASTWYHMFRFFQWSYLEWETINPLTTSDQNTLRIGEWLRDTALFKQAWFSTLETAPRAWWSLQIFGFCAIWSVMLAGQERNRRIPYAWAFMLLGQVVAISFATNLFFLAILTHEEARPSPKKDVAGSVSTRRSQDKAVVDSRPSSTLIPRLYDGVVVLTIALALSIPNVTSGQAVFLPLLLAPHILAFVQLLMNQLLPATTTSPATLKDAPSTLVRIGTMVSILVVASRAVGGFNGDMATIMATLYGHPAVSSVGWDVIWCWVSHTAWYFCGQMTS